MAQPQESPSPQALSGKMPGGLCCFLAKGPNQHRESLKEQQDAWSRDGTQELAVGPQDIHFQEMEKDHPAQKCSKHFTALLLKRKLQEFGASCNTNKQIQCCR